MNNSTTTSWFPSGRLIGGKLVLVYAATFTTFTLPTTAQSPPSFDLPSPVVTDVPMFGLPTDDRVGSPMLNEQLADSAVSPSWYEPNDLPTSITKPNGVLALAIDGPAALPSLPMRSTGCNAKPVLQCTGPNYCGCHPQTYYRTNPCDDDPVLTKSPTVNDSWTNRWYRKALDMVRRKKIITEAINR